MTSEGRRAYYETSRHLQIIPGMDSANETWHYFVISSFIGWAHTQKNLCDTYTLPTQVSQGVSFLNILEINNCVIHRLNYILL